MALVAAFLPHPSVLHKHSRMLAATSPGAAFMSQLWKIVEPTFWSLHEWQPTVVSARRESQVATAVALAGMTSPCGRSPSWVPNVASFLVRLSLDHQPTNNDLETYY